MTQLTVSQPAAALLLAPPWPARGAGPGVLDQDALLVRACRRGDQGALERLVERFQVAIVGTASAAERPGRGPRAGQHGLLQAGPQPDRYDPARPLRPWVLRIATNEALNWLRGARRERERLLGARCRRPGPGPPAGRPEPEGRFAAERRTVVRAAGALTPASPAAPDAAFYHQLTYAEIGQRTGQDANTVGVQRYGPPAPAR